ncbi:MULTISPECIES: nickel/cobalt transporter [unclassified Thioalkalivibrio]|uniref:nickel/cobalt transporter n=1 Tax=unclassified Thioalkalivibrio TaxID=2621013 RepID=UPI00037A58DB|nr:MULTISPECIES: nickel/cobalt transporter [unclassified Thioalkalivibrio]
MHHVIHQVRPPLHLAPPGLLVLLALLMLWGGPGLAQAETGHPLGAPTEAPAERGSPAAPDHLDTLAPLADSPGPLERLTGWMLQTQRQLHRSLTEGLHALRDGPTAHTAGALILVSLLYGIFHAAGPGHGKAVISAYLLTQPQNLRRGILLSTVSALAQGVTAIVLVGVLIGLFGWLARDTLGQVRTLEIASFALVAMLGLWLMARALRHAWRLHRAHRAASVHGHDHDHGDTHGHEHDPDCGCGTPHHVDPDHRGTWWGTVLAVGIRPCSGAVLIMAVSAALGLAWAGVAAVLAMSLGTAATVSVLATLAVSARDWTRRWLGPTRMGRLTYIGPALGLAGGGVIALIGLSLVLGAIAYQPVAHPLGIR